MLEPDKHEELQTAGTKPMAVAVAALQRRARSVFAVLRQAESFGLQHVTVGAVIEAGVIQIEAYASKQADEKGSTSQRRRADHEVGELKAVSLANVAIVVAQPTVGVTVTPSLARRSSEAEHALQIGSKAPARLQKG